MPLLPVPSSKEVAVGSVRWPVNECVHIIMHHTVCHSCLRLILAPPGMAKPHTGAQVLNYPDGDSLRQSLKYSAWLDAKCTPVGLVASKVGVAPISGHAASHGPGHVAP